MQIRKVTESTATSQRSGITKKMLGAFKPVVCSGCNPGQYIEYPECLPRFPQSLQANSEIVF